MKVECGKEVGDALLREIKKVKKRIYVVSPYLSEEMIELLRRKAQEGVDVKLLTNDVKALKAGDKTRTKRSIKEGLKEEIETFFTVIFWTFVLGMAAAAYKPLQKAIAVLIALIFTLYFFYLNYKALSFFWGLFTRPFRKSETSFEVKIPLDFVHAKLYIVDEKAYMGSANFTKSGMYSNVECLAEMGKDEAEVLESQFKKLWSS